MRRIISTLFVLVLSGVALVATPLSSTAAPITSTVYDAIPDVLPGNVVSQAFEATTTVEFGDHVRLGPGPRIAAAFRVILSSWGCESGSWTAGCVTTPGATFTHDITLRLYEVDGSGAVPAPGAEILETTESFAIPYRPSADADCAGGTRWEDAGGSCFNGLAHEIAFDLTSSGVVLPSEVIWTVAYDTTHYGDDPLGEGESCFTEDGGCGYDSLNVGAERFADSPFAGLDVSRDGAFLRGSSSYPYCDGGASGTLRLDEGSPGDAHDCWDALDGYTPLAAIDTTADATASTVVVSPSDMHGWAFAEEIPAGDGEMVAGPPTPPAGVGSAELTVDDDGRELLLSGDYAGTRFDHITSLGFHTLRQVPVGPPDTLSLTLQFDVDYDLDDVDTSWQGRLVFEPVYTVGATIDTDTWYEWSPLEGNWWASGAPGNAVCSTGDPCTWLELLDAFPNAGVRVMTGPFPGFTMLKAGGPVPGGFTGNADALRIGVLDPSGSTIEETTWDFEPDTLGGCAVTVVGTTITLLADCYTETTIFVPDGFTLDGGPGDTEYTIFAVDPDGPTTGAAFTGAVVQNEGASMHLMDIKISADELQVACRSGDDRLKAVALHDAEGSITGVDVLHADQMGDAGCQEGNGIDVRTSTEWGKGTPRLPVTIAGNTVADYQKTGILVSGGIAATVTGNAVTGLGPIDFIASNGLQVSFGASAKIYSNTLEGNDYTPKSFIACGLIIYKAGGISASTKSGLDFVRDENTFADNEKDVCNFGKGGTFSPTT